MARRGKTPILRGVQLPGCLPKELRIDPGLPGDGLQRGEGEAFSRGGKGGLLTFQLGGPLEEPPDLLVGVSSRRILGRSHNGEKL